MFHTSNNIPSDLSPINAGIEFLVHKPTYRDVFSSYEIQPVADFGAGFLVVCRSYYAFDGLRKDEIGDLIAGEKGTGECSTVSGEDKYFF